MVVLLTAEQVLTDAEARSCRVNPARIGSVDSNDLADFRHAVRYAAVGAVIHVPAPQAQTDHYPCVGQLSDGTRVFAVETHPGVDAGEWSSIAD